jgi:replication-associated recombination protein RarA
LSNLALEKRPQSLDEVIGLEGPKAALRSILEKGNIPTVALFIGPPGCGKTTLARIFARAVQGAEDGVFDIREINGADKRKIEDIRALIDDSHSLPMCGKYRVFIIDECHQLTNDSQNALLIPTEAKNSSTLWLLCSTDPEKILPALRSRCSAATFQVRPMGQTQIQELVTRTAPTLDAAEIAQFLAKRRVQSPREVLGACDLRLAGTPLEECVFGQDHKVEYRDVAKAVVAGDWDTARDRLALLKTPDTHGLRAVLAAYLKYALIQTPIGPRARALSGCLLSMTQVFEDGVSFAATAAACYRCCEAIGQAK